MEEVKEYLVSGKLGFANGFLGDPKRGRNEYTRVHHRRDMFR